MNNKTLVALIALITLSPKSFAAKRDLRIFNTLSVIGVEADPGMSKLQMTVLEIECSYSHISENYDCSMNDASANEGEGGPLAVTGKKANKLFNLLAREGALPDNGMGHVYLSAAAISCTQVHEGVAEGDLAERTDCSVEIERKN